MSCWRDRALRQPWEDPDGATAVLEDDDGGLELYDSLIEARLDAQDYFVGVYLLSGAGDIELEIEQF